MSNQEFIPASEFCDLVTDGTHDSPKKTEFGVKLVTSKNIVGGKLDLTSAYFISESDAQNINKRSQVHINDILLSMIGTVGEVALIEKEPDFVIKNVGLLKNSDPKKAKWLYYYLKSPITQNLIKDRLRGTTQQYIPLGELRNLPILKPNSEEHLQNTIDQLSSLDKKIQLNTQINQTLEQIAQALFKSWFVDFDPVHAKVQALSDGLSLEQAELAAMQAISGKTPEELTALSQTQPDRYAELAETAKAFPCEMVEVDGVEVPKGWEIKPIELILDRLKNKQKLRKEEISFEGTIPVFEQGASILMGYHDKDAAFNASTDEPIFIFGDHTCITKLSTIPFSIYQNVIPLIGKNLPTYWVYCAIQNKQTFQEYRRHWAELIVKEVVVPDNINLCQYFSKKVKWLFLKIDINHQENKTLIDTRELLLPKLLNGEIE